MIVKMLIALPDLVIQDLFFNNLKKFVGSVDNIVGSFLN